MKSQATVDLDISKINYLTEQSLRDANCRTLKEGAELLRILPANLYNAHFKPAFQSTIGAHFRHFLEHYRCFFGQLGTAVFDYDKRERDFLLEQDCEYAADAVNHALSQLESLKFKELNFRFRMLDHYSPEPIETSIARELAFLNSHTIHHYALIAAIARGLGVEPQADFGIAIATLCYQQSETKTQQS